MTNDAHEKVLTRELFWQLHTQVRRLLIRVSSLHIEVEKASLCERTSTEDLLKTSAEINELNQHLIKLMLSSRIPSRLTLRLENQLQSISRMADGFISETYEAGLFLDSSNFFAQFREASLEAMEEILSLEEYA